MQDAEVFMPERLNQEAPECTGRPKFQFRFIGSRVEGLEVHGTGNVIDYHCT